MEGEERKLEKGVEAFYEKLRKYRLRVAKQERQLKKQALPKQDNTKAIE